jgi:hypothetical protein
VNRLRSSPGVPIGRGDVGDRQHKTVYYGVSVDGPGL